MQERHLDRLRYFTELADTSREFYIDYVRKYYTINDGCNVLEVGCGEGGNLLPFAEIGCNVTGIDRSEQRIAEAKSFYESMNIKAKFVSIDFFELDNANGGEKYDIVLVHDVIEHIRRKDEFLKHLQQFVANSGIIFWRFPAWQMPFGGHQQICRNKFCSKLPFFHLLPLSIYRRLLYSFGEQQSCVDELIDIKMCRVSIEKFERLLKSNNYIPVNRCLWLINPHYKQKFNLKPRKLPALISHLRYIRNFFTTSCFYITKLENTLHPANPELSKETER
ncbi:MAG: class I SAM-dependent methyltransferase [Proteiniphilum sp.]|jgi:SAM-dependent methyltransferase|nr:class I SAM-dependent methyltransferase [Proteiniphilum sp.]